LDKENLKQVDKEWRKNFFSVAARSSSDHMYYRRDLKALLELSMQVDEQNLALDLGKFDAQTLCQIRRSLHHEKYLTLSFPILATEILESKRLLQSDEIPRLVLSALRNIGMGALGVAMDKEREETGFRLLTRVLKLFPLMSDNDAPCCRESIVVSHELHAFFQEWKVKSGSSADDTEMFRLIDFVVDQSSPDDVLCALIRWTSDYQVGHSMFPRLDALLRQGVHDSLKSGQPSLFRLQQARLNYSQENRILSSTGYESEGTGGGVWRLMSSGELSITK
jgi:hypothetical protein